MARGDFEGFDLLIAMDRQNRDDLLAMARSEEDRAKVRLLRSYADGELDVPDPYYGGEDGFADVVEIVERSCRALLDEVSADTQVSELPEVAPGRHAAPTSRWRPRVSAGWPRPTAFGCPRSSALAATPAGSRSSGSRQAA